MGRPFNRLHFIIGLTIAYALLVLTGLIFLILSSTSFQDVFIDVVALLISGSSILVAFLAQISSEREHKRMEIIEQEIDIIDENLNSDIRTDHSIQRKLDKILELDEKIYKKLGGRIPPKS